MRAGSDIRDRLSALILRERGEFWVAYAAACWASVFAAFHIIWAAGWYPLLDAEQARIAFATPWKWTYDVVVAAMCVIAVPVALLGCAGSRFLAQKAGDIATARAKPEQ